MCSAIFFVYLNISAAPTEYANIFLKVILPSNTDLSLLFIPVKYPTANGSVGIAPKVLSHNKCSLNTFLFTASAKYIGSFAIVPLGFSFFRLSKIAPKIANNNKINIVSPSANKALFLLSLLFFTSPQLPVTISWIV